MNPHEAKMAAGQFVMDGLDAMDEDVLAALVGLREAVDDVQTRFQANGATTTQAKYFINGAVFAILHPPNIDD